MKSGWEKQDNFLLYFLEQSIELYTYLLEWYTIMTYLMFMEKYKALKTLYLQCTIKKKQQIINLQIPEAEANSEN